MNLGTKDGVKVEKSVLIIGGVKHIFLLNAICMTPMTS